MEIAGLPKDVLAILNDMEYECVKKIGDTGAFGIVYLVRSCESGQEYVLKALNDRAMEDDCLRTAFATESELWSNLRSPGHKNIVHLEKLAKRIDNGIERRCLFLEYVKGRSLKKLLVPTPQTKRVLPFPVQQSVEVAIQFCDGMLYCQEVEKGFVHRDIKPDNIMLRQDNILKIIDLGLSKSLGLSSGISQVFRGAQGYIAPELASKWLLPDRISIEEYKLGDIYSFGITMKTLFGVPPDVSLPNALEGVPDELSDIIWKSAQPEPNKRYQTFGGIRAALVEVKDGLKANRLRASRELWGTHHCETCGYIPNPIIYPPQHCPLCDGQLVSINRTPPPPPLPPPTIELRPPTLGFGAVQVGECENKGFEIRNAGRGVLTVAQVSFSTKIFAVEPLSLPLRIAAGEQKEVSVGFSPDQAQSFYDDLVIVSNDVRNPTVIVAVSGKGKVPPPPPPPPPDRTYVLIPSGTFWKGCPADDAQAIADRYFPGSKQNKQALLAHRWAQVTIQQEYSICRYAVTNEQYWEFTQAMGHALPPHWDSGHTPPYPQNSHNHPVTSVTWFDAVAYCRWKGERLPTDYEWERAARGTDGRLYPWGNVYDLSRCNTAESGIGATVPVGDENYGAGQSPEGLFHLTGNVWEWVEPAVSAVSEVGLRGGSFRDDCRLAGMAFAGLLRMASDHREDNIGFRIARPCAGRHYDKIITLRGHRMVLIPGGSYTKGCPNSEVRDVRRIVERFGFDQEDFLDRHREQVSELPSFYMSKCAVSNTEYLLFVQETGHAQPEHWRQGVSPFAEAHRDLPVVNISAEDAIAYCEWIGNSVRLPTGDEWEKAARGTDGLLYPWGKVFDAAKCNCGESGASQLVPGSYHPEGESPYGLCNMVGNVWEMVNEATTKHLRGGSFVASCSIYGLTFFPMRAEPGYRSHDCGFRCVRQGGVGS